MNQRRLKPNSIRIRLIFIGLIVFTCFLVWIGCSVSQTVEKTTQKIKRTTRKITQTFTRPDEDLKRTVGMFDFENKALHESRDFQKIFHKGLPEFLIGKCPGIIMATSDSGGFPNSFKEPPRLESGLIDNFALAIIGRQLGLNAIVTGSLDDIRIIDELKGILWTKDTHHIVQVAVRVEVYGIQTGTKILDETFQRNIEIDDIEYQLIRESEQLKLPELNETLNQLLTDIGDRICDAIRSQPWHGYITKIDGDKYIISSGSRVGLRIGNILEVYDSSRIIEGVGGQRFFAPGLKTGEIEIVAITGDRAETRLVSGEGIIKGNTVRRKD